MRSAVRRLISVMLCAAVFVTCAGCGGSKEDTQQTSLGVDNEIAGFLLNFDQREETSRMVKDKAKGIYPERVNWSYGENLKVDEKPGEYSSSDPEFAKDVFYALSNTIIMGNSDNHSEETPFYIEMMLQSGETVRYNFVSVNTIRLSEQNYVIESDGNLWALIRKATKEAAQEEPEEKKETEEAAAEDEIEEPAEEKETDEAVQTAEPMENMADQDEADNGAEKDNE